MDKKTRFTPLKMTLRDILATLPVAEIARAFDEMGEEGLYEDHECMEYYAETIQILLAQPKTEGSEELTVFPWITNNGKCFPEMNLHSVMQIAPGILDAPLTTFTRFGVKKRHIAAEALYYLNMTEWVNDQSERTFVHKSALETDEV